MNVLNKIDEDYSFVSSLIKKKRKLKILKKRPCYLISLDENEFYRRFRMSKISFEIFLQKIEPKLSPKNKKS
jgi:hypothetical protein